jgi:hypothetical protein
MGGQFNSFFFLQTLSGRKTVLIDDCSLEKSFTQKVVLCVLKVFLLLFYMQRKFRTRLDCGTQIVAVSPDFFWGARRKKVEVMLCD